MEEVVELINLEFWKNKRVLVTGHTGFKGTWLCILLQLLGAEVSGYGLEPPTKPSLFECCKMGKKMESTQGNICDGSTLTATIERIRPDIVFHLAAQSLVRYSYHNPVETYATNVMGTVNLLEAVRSIETVRAVVNVTTDKCYDNREWVWGYRENDSLGGKDPYSSSKACSELVTEAYRQSFFQNYGASIASARAGNVIGGGDWAKDRLIPDCIKSILQNETIILRNPQSTRPWQHVFDPLRGYLMLAENLYTNGSDFAECWNFGPSECNIKTVQWIVERLCKGWKHKIDYQFAKDVSWHEANYLKLDSSKAASRLGWHSLWNIDIAIEKTLEWVDAYSNNDNMYFFSQCQVNEYISEYMS